MIGEGAIRRELEQQVSSSPYPDSVLFTGFRRDVARLMAACDVLILPTLWEGLGTVLLDGLLAGCAVIGTDVGGVPEIIQDQQTGLLIPAKDPFAIANAVSTLAASPQLRSQLLRRGQSHVAKNFSLSSMIEGNYKTYQELTRRSP
jgi:glycosyltransferase involved in cell wall biosynthesis